MATLNISLTTTCKALSGGTDEVAGVGSNTVLTVGSSGSGWAVGDTFTVIFTDTSTGGQTQVGAGNVTGITPTFALTFNDKIYLLAGTGLYFSALADPTKFNDPNGSGNGYIRMGNQNGTPENQVALATYQGYLAVIARRTTQIWAVDADPAQNARQQILPNIGTMAPLSVHNIGDRDVLLLADSGIRSIRPRVASQNAEVIDIGTPIDALVQTSLLALTDAEKATACGVVEPSANRYWCYIPGASGAVGKIYVLSSFPNSEIAAWTTYAPTYQVAITPTSKTFPVTAGQVYAWKPAAAGDTLACGTVSLTKAGIFTAPSGATTAVVTGSAAGTLSRQDSFSPEKFSTYLGRIYCRAGDNVFLYGGTDNNTYDQCGVTARLPYLDVDSPCVQKDFRGVDAAIEGDWSMSVSTDYATADFSKIVYRNNASSFQRAKVPMNRRATHFAMQFEELGNAYARLSSVTVHFAGNQSK